MWGHDTNGPQAANNGTAEDKHVISAPKAEAPEMAKSVDQINARFKATRKSRTGCLTCKFRKKKCDDTKPICRDCQRFGKECVWVDYSSMDKEEIRVLRQQVQEKERNQKLRRRKKLSREEESVSPSDEGDGVSVAVSGQESHALQESDALGHELHALGHELHALGQESHALGMNMPPAHAASALGPNVTALEHSSSTLGHESDRSGQGLHAHEQPQAAGPNAANSPPKTDYDLLDLHTPAFDMHMGEFGTESRSVSLTNLFRAAQDPQSSSALLHFLKDLSHTGTPEVTKHPYLRPAKDELPFNNVQLFDIASGFMSSYLPSPRPSLSLLPELDSQGLYLYNYYCETLSRKISIAPSINEDSNSYQRVFLPLAHRDRGVLYGILAWAGFHLGGKWMAEGSQYARLAANQLNDDKAEELDEADEWQRNEGFSGENGEKEPVFSAQPDGNRRAIINKLATLLILCGAEICRGDIKYWSVFLKWGANLLKMNGGIMNFNNNKEEHWLISNFAYHDLLASSTVERGTYFPNEVYSEIFRDKPGISRGNLNPLLGVSKWLFKMIGDISKLSREAKHAITFSDMGGDDAVEMGSLDTEMAPDSAGSRAAHLGQLSEVAEKASLLEGEISALSPESEDLENLSEPDWELQLTTFEALKLSCILYLRQAVFRVNPSALQSRLLCSRLIERINVLLPTSVQATLVFPIFMAGIHCVSVQERQRMRLRFDDFMKSYGPWNIVRVKAVVEKVWMENPAGDLVVDWNDMLNEMGWEVNFA